MELDLRERAFKVLEIAKRNLQQYGVLDPVAFLVTADEVYLVEVPPFSNDAEKQVAYAWVIAQARKHNAMAMITLNDAYVGEGGDDDDYYEGKLAAENAPECIILTLAGPSIPTWTLMVRYRRSADGITFGETEEYSGSKAPMLQGWASESLRPS